jgi:ATP-binding cassette, subfamily B, bacterial CvaB/MchF/RaxB
MSQVTTKRDEVGVDVTAHQTIIIAFDVEKTYETGRITVEALRSVNLTVERGEMVAIMGPSGSGKSTLARLLAGLYTPTAGQIWFDEIELRHWHLARFREQLGIVTQDTRLFSGTLRDNVTMFDPSVSQDEVVRACRLACLHDTILEMPMGYDTFVGHMGSVLSGGQRQRVLLARALYKRPSILILDEATSHLDADREQLVNLAVSKLDITRIIIAHREETLRSADRVIRLGVPNSTVSRNAEKFPTPTDVE